MVNSSPPMEVYFDMSLDRATGHSVMVFLLQDKTVLAAHNFQQRQAIYQQLSQRNICIYVRGFIKRSHLVTLFGENVPIETFFKEFQSKDRKPECNVLYMYKSMNAAHAHDLAMDELARKIEQVLYVLPAKEPSAKEPLAKERVRTDADEPRCKRPLLWADMCE